MIENASIETILAHAGYDPDPATGAVVPPIHLSTTFERDSDGSYGRGYIYSRNENPTRGHFEEVIARLEGGVEGLAFSSGMAASAAILQALRPGDHVILASDLYYGMRRLVKTVFLDWEIDCDEVDVTDSAALERALRKRTKIVWVETPSNPLLNLIDLKAVADVAHKGGALVAVDNSWATPVLQRPISFGADIVVHSVTKYLAGHSDVLGGAVVFAEHSDFSERVRHIQIAAGAVMDPFSAWLSLRGMRSLSARLRVQCENARQVAAFLNNHLSVEKTNFPGLPSHPGHQIALRQMRDFGGMMSIEVAGDRERALQIAGRTQIFKRATSLGGTESLIEHRASLEGDSGTVPENLLRLSIGLEDPDDLISDLSRALEA